MISMKDKPLTPVHIFLDFRNVDASDTVRDDLNNAIATMAPTSPLWGNPGVQAEVSNLAATLVAYKDASKAAVKSAQQHKLDLEKEADAKAANNKSLNALRTLVENGSVTPADVKSMGFVPYEGPPPKPPLLPPLQLDVELGKKGHGKAKVSAHETGTTRRHYAAQSSPDGITWTELIGHGKSRRLSGKSGTSIWVRFALELGSERSEWSVAVQITFP
jgi:hypothetical protein